MAEEEDRPPAKVHDINEKAKRFERLVVEEAAEGLLEAASVGIHVLTRDEFLEAAGYAYDRCREGLDTNEKPPWEE